MILMNFLSLSIHEYQCQTCAINTPSNNKLKQYLSLAPTKADQRELRDLPHDKRPKSSTEVGDESIPYTSFLECSNLLWGEFNASGWSTHIVNYRLFDKEVVMRVKKRDELP